MLGVHDGCQLQLLYAKPLNSDVAKAFAKSATIILEIVQRLWHLAEI